MMSFTRSLAFTLIVLHSLAAHAEETPATDPRTAALLAETARLKAENDLLTQQAALIKSQFGTPATAPTGAISNPEKFAAMGQWTLGAATTELAAEAANVWKEGTESKRCGPTAPETAVLITSSPDRQAQYVAADLIRQRLIQFTEALNGTKDQPIQTRTFAPITGAGAIVQGVVGTLDSLVALFRADYTIGDLSVTSDDFTLRLAVASRLEKDCPNVAYTVDQLSAPVNVSYPLIDTTYHAFGSARATAQGAYAEAIATAKTDAEKAKLAGAKALLDSATAFDTALTTPADGQIPLVNAATVLAASDKPHWVLYVKFGTYSSSMITRKHLLSRNDLVTAVAGGQGQVVLFNTKGEIVSTRLFRIDKRVGGKLSAIVESAEPLGSVQK